jgi:outer membrane biosynthesis protein TonB
MRRVHRMIALATLLAFGSALAGCSDFDPDKLDVFHLNDKKKLPGKREPLFPNGVPGVSQGIPPEYMKGYQAQQDQAATAALGEPAAGQPGAAPANNAAAPQPANQKTAAVTPVESKPKPKPRPKPRAKAKPKPKHKPKAASKPAPQPAAAPQQQQTQPWPGTQPQRGSAAPWPSTPQDSTTAPWPGSK